MSNLELRMYTYCQYGHRLLKKQNIKQLGIHKQASHSECSEEHFRGSPNTKSRLQMNPALLTISELTL